MSVKLTGSDFLNDSRRREIDQEYAAKIGKIAAKCMPYLLEMSRVDTGSETGLYEENRAGGKAVKVETYRTGERQPASVRMRIIRRFGADELPAVINVHEGSMVMAGSRLVRDEDLERQQRANPQKFALWNQEVYQPYPPALIGIGSLRRRFNQLNPHSPELDNECMDLELAFARTVTEKDYVRIIRRTLLEQGRAFMHLAPGKTFDFMQHESSGLYLPVGNPALEVATGLSEELAFSEA